MKSLRARLHLRFEVLGKQVVLALLLGGLLGGLVPRPAYGQVTRANLSGVVTDDSGGLLPGATVTITNPATGSKQVLVTGAEGNYRAVPLPPAPYEVTVELPGFAPAKREVTLTVGSDVTMNVKLGIAAVQESLTVVAETPLVQPTTAQLTSVVMVKDIEGLPVLSRNFLELAQILPGAGPDNSPVQAFTATRFGGVADQRNGYTTIIDGGALDDSIWGSTVFNLTEDAVQEFTVFRSQFDAQYGQALNAIVNVATKSGTNKLDGAGFYFGRDRRLSATNVFATEKPPFSQKRWGGSVGGPIVLNKTHFFFAGEYNKVDTVKTIALPPTNPFSALVNGNFPSGSNDKMAVGKVNHRFNDAHSLFVRYAYDNQFLLRDQQVTSDDQQADEFNRTHSVVGQESWVISQKIVNSLNFQLLKQRLGVVNHGTTLGINRPSASFGQAIWLPQYFPRTKVTVGDAVFVNQSKHAVKFGGDVTFAVDHHQSYWNQQGEFSFGTDAAFDATDSATWPYEFSIQRPGLWTYRSKIFDVYVQDDWQVASRVRLNLGLRYDLDLNLRNNDFYQSLLDDPRYAGIDRFISSNRGNDYNTLQPRLGIVWDTRGDGSVVVRGGFGRYVTRNRPWFNLTSIDQSQSLQVRIEDPERLRLFPDVNAVLGGQSLEAFLAAGGARLLYLISDQFQLPYSLNATAGIGWQINAKTSFTADYVHDYATKQLGSTDYNLPASGAISATNPRPVAAFSQVGVLENYSRSWYDALETQLRTRFRGVDAFLVSYTFSRAYRDGVNFYGDYRGTQRTPQEQGYTENDQRHNLSVSATVTLPGDFQVSGIGKFISGSPFFVQAGFDLDGDASIQGDRPRDLPTRVGRGNVDQELEIINAFRTANGQPAISRDLLRLDPYVTADIRLTKSIRVGGGRRRLQLFAEGYNLTNHANYLSYSVNANMIAPDFLIRNAARDPRQGQLGVRYQF